MGGVVAKVRTPLLASSDTAGMLESTSTSATGRNTEMLYVLLGENSFIYLNVQDSKMVPRCNGTTTGLGQLELGLKNADAQIPPPAVNL